jgi:hypothetical protein
MHKRKKSNYKICNCHSVGHGHIFNEELICSHCKIRWSDFNLANPMVTCVDADPVLPWGKPTEEA